MKRQGTGKRDQGTERLAALLQNAVPPVGEACDATGDLWPAMQRRLRTEAGAKAPPLHVPWFDWALAGGLVLLLGAFPAWIPVLLYYL